MAQQFYTQCRMVRAFDGRVWEDVAWIPTEFAQVGRRLRIGAQEGWRVTGRGSVLSEDDAVTNSRDHLSQRDASDIDRAPSRVFDQLRR